VAGNARVGLPTYFSILGLSYSSQLVPGPMWPENQRRKNQIMAKVKIEEIVDHLDSEMRRALEDALREVAPGIEIDSYVFFRAFRRAVGRKCNTWESVPDGFIRAE
jgi:hypothetical protein